MSGRVYILLAIILLPVFISSSMFDALAWPSYDIQISVDSERPGTPDLVSNASQAKHFHILVSRNGFNASRDPISLVVNEGDAVTLEFVYADSDLNYDNPHRMFVESYNLQTDIINKEQTVTILQFVATKPGNFSIYCDLPCAGMMYLQNAQLVVRQSSGNLLGTLMSLSVQREQFGTGSFRFVAKVSDAYGQPLGGVPVEFFVRTTFGLLSIGTGLTDAEGVVTLEYDLKISGQLEITVVFSGGGHLAPSQTSITVNVKHATGSAETYPAIPGMQRTLAVSLVLLVVGSVWASYGVVLGLIRKLRYAVPFETRAGAPMPAAHPVFAKGVAFFVGVFFLGVLSYALIVEFVGFQPTLLLPIAVLVSFVETAILTLAMQAFRDFSNTAGGNPEGD